MTVAGRRYVSGKLIALILWKSTQGLNVESGVFSSKHGDAREGRLSNKYGIYTKMFFFFSFFNL